MMSVIHVTQRRFVSCFYYFFFNQITKLLITFVLSKIPCQIMTRSNDDDDDDDDGQHHHFWENF